MTHTKQSDLERHYSVAFTMRDMQNMQRVAAAAYNQLQLSGQKSEELDTLITKLARRVDWIKKHESGELDA